MHHPQLTQLDCPIGLSRSNVIAVFFPLPIRPMTISPATSVQARTQRSQSTQALWSTWIDEFVKSVPLLKARGVYVEGAAQRVTYFPSSPADLVLSSVVSSRP